MKVVDLDGTQRLWNAMSSKVADVQSNLDSALNSATETLNGMEEEIQTLRTDSGTIKEQMNKIQNDADGAVSKALDAADKAGAVNAVLDNDVLTVTDRNNVSKSIQLLDDYENVTVTLSTTVSGVSVKNTAINVYINHDTKTPTTYTTNDSGVATFRVSKGQYYEVVFPDKANCGHVAPIGYTATISAREIKVSYEEAETKKEEIHILTRIMDTDSTSVVVAPKYTFSLNVNGSTTEYTTDDKGEYVTQIEIGKPIEVTSQDQNNMKLVSSVPVTYTANATIKYIYLYFSQTILGVGILDKQLKQFTAQEWVNAGKSKEDAFLIRISTSLSFNKGADIYMDAQAIANKSYTATYAWQGVNTNLLLDTPSTVDTFSGEQLSNNYVAQAQTNSVTVPAISAALTFQLTDGNGGIWKGYLGSSDQWDLVQKNVTEVDALLSAIFGDEITYTNNYASKWKWTSTQSSSGSAYNFTAGQNYGSKGSSGLVFPFFALTRNITN